MIGVFGDSIAFGMSDFKGGWVNRLKKDFKIINRSIPGETTTGLLNRIKKNLDQLNPNTIIIAVGINDSSIFFKKHTIPLIDFKKNYELIIKLAKTHTNKIICIGLTYINEKKINPYPIRRFKSYNNNSIKKYDSIIKELAKKENIHYIYIHDLLKNEDLADGLHPNSKGHKKIYEKIKKELNKLCKS